MQRTLYKNNLGENTFSQLLDWLGENRDDAANKYSEIHYHLILFFSARGCAESEDLADETINRVMQKISSENIKYKGNQLKYFYGFAKNIYLEYLRDRDVQMNLDWIEDKKSDENNLIEVNEISVSKICLKKCLAELKGNDKALILEYYNVDSGREKEYRKKIAKKYKLSPNLLRVKIFRLKKSVTKCLENCVNSSIVVI